MNLSLALDAPPKGCADTAAQVRAARAGSEAAFAWLYRRHLPWVHGVLLARMRPAQADELTQECFALAFRRLHQLREPAHFGAWVAQIARRLRVREHESPMDSDLHVAVDPNADPERHAEAARLLATLQRLPEAYRETLALRLIEGLSGAEIATLSGLTPESVRVNLHRGMQKLRSLLGTDGGSPT